MKWLFLSLLLLNLLLGLWELRVAAPEPADQSQTAMPTILLLQEYQTARRGSQISAHIEQGVAGLQYAARDAILGATNKPVNNAVRELMLAKAIRGEPESSRRVEPVVPPVEEAPKPMTLCYQAGPFADEYAMSQWLKSHALKKAATVIKDQSLPADYQVYFPSAKTAEQQLKNKLMLNAKGLVDIWTVQSGDNKGAFSLGVFSDVQRANTFRKDLLDKGVKAEVRQRSNVVQQFYGKVVVNDEQQKRELERLGSMLSPCR